MPETLEAPKPAAVAPAPSPAPPPPTPPPTPSTPEPDAFVAELSKKFDDLGVPPEKGKEPEKPKEPAKETPRIEVKTDPKGKEQPQKPSPDDDPRNPAAWKKLRADRERFQSELQVKEAALAEHQKKIAEWEAKGKDSEQLLSRLQTLEKERDEAKARERRARREVSDDFKAKWDEPFNEMAEDASAVISQLQVTVTDQNGIDSQRQASWEKDFAAIFAMDRGNALRSAKAMFGEEAGLVMDYYTRMHENRRGRARELKKVQENWAAEEKKEQEELAQKAAQEEQNKGKFKELSEKVIKEIGDSVDDYHDPADVDKSIAEERRKGYEIWDTKATTLQGELTKRAHARHRFAAFGPMKLTILRLQKENAELKETIAGNKLKVPHPKDPGGAAGGGESKETWEESARKELLP